MYRILLCLLLATAARAQTSQPDPLIQKIQQDVADPKAVDQSAMNTDVPKGMFLQGKITDSQIYPGTENNFSVYVPAQYDPSKPACLLIKLDGMGPGEGKVLDHLIAAKEIPVMIGVGIVPGSISIPVATGPGRVTDTVAKPTTRRVIRANRSYEFDSTNDNFPNYVLNELLPAVEKMTTSDGRAIHLSKDGNDHMTTGGSTGGIGSFTLAWRRPDQFRRVYSIIGTFVSMRGGHDYPALIRKTEPKPIRIFLEDGNADAWNPLFGSWFDANLNMESALTFAGYDVGHAWGTHGHNGAAGTAAFPDVMRWMWRDYPKPIEVGTSQNTTLKAILPDNKGWEQISLAGKQYDLTSIAVNGHGDLFASTRERGTQIPACGPIIAIGADGQVTHFHPEIKDVSAIVIASNGDFVASQSDAHRVIAIDSSGGIRTIADGIDASCLLPCADGSIVVSERSAQRDEIDSMLAIDADGHKRPLGASPAGTGAIAYSIDHSLFFAAEKRSPSIWSYVVQPDGSLSDGEPFYWLHTNDVQGVSGAAQIASDNHGDLYVATNMGVQVCDQNGRVRAILPLPTPASSTCGLCFGGPEFDELYVTDGRQLFKRHLKTHGVLPAAKPTTYPSEGAG